MSNPEEKFETMYPHANVEDFEFKSGKVSYKLDGKLYDITQPEFKNKYEYALQWQPRRWNSKGSLQPFKVNKNFDTEINSLKIYVNEATFFTIKLPKPDITWNATSSSYTDNTYVASLYAAYIATYACGLSTKHFKYTATTPKIITSIARYHLYFHMMRFLRDPSSLRTYITADMTQLINDNTPVKYEWLDKFAWGKMTVGIFLRSKPSGSVRKVVPKIKNPQGQIGINYQERKKLPYNSLDDFAVFVSKKSTGLTNTGLLLLQQSIQSYVYSVLGAQANTRWPIVGGAAMSLQTQQEFKKLVQATIVQTDQKRTIDGMRTAVQATNMALDMVVSPGVMLIPSNMLMDKSRIVGYNNAIKMANSYMVFGKNVGVNTAVVAPVLPQITGTTGLGVVAVKTPGVGSVDTLVVGPKVVPVVAPVVSKPVSARVRPISRPGAFDNSSEMYLLGVSLILGAVAPWFIRVIL